MDDETKEKFRQAAKICYENEGKYKKEYHRHILGSTQMIIKYCPFSSRDLEKICASQGGFHEVIETDKKGNEKKKQRRICKRWLEKKTLNLKL